VARPPSSAALMTAPLSGKLHSLASHMRQTPEPLPLHSWIPQEGAAFESTP